MSSKEGVDYYLNIEVECENGSWYTSTKMLTHYKTDFIGWDIRSIIDKKQ